jgi:nucleoside-diphosphate-sugar epimerase
MIASAKPKKEGRREPVATCLITGGAGNLACQLTWPLAGRFDRVVLLDVADRPVGPTAANACFERGDLLDGLGLDALFARHSPALQRVDVDCRQLVGRRLQDVAVIVDLHELARVGGRAAGG